MDNICKNAFNCVHTFYFPFYFLNTLLLFEFKALFSNREFPID